MNISFLLVGLSSLLFALWTAYGLYRRYKGTLPERPAKQKKWFGVCVDFSETVGIPVSIIKFFVLVYTPVGLGPVFILSTICSTEQ